MSKKIKDLKWNEIEFKHLDETLFTYHSPGVGRFTVVDRMTGFGWRDIETGFKDLHGRFWLASGNFDIREFSDKSIVDAANLIKKFSNTCSPNLLNKE